jgi:phenylpyruvate tautomerase
MPLLKITYRKFVESEAERQQLLTEGSRIVAEVMGKPERFVMAVCERHDMAFGGTTDDCAFVELRSLGGLDPETNAALSLRLCELMRDVAAVPMDRVFLNFVDMARGDWGYNGGTFARPRGL